MEENEKKKIIVKAKTNTTISEIAKKQIEESKYTVVGAIFNNEYKNLDDELQEDGTLEFFLEFFEIYKCGRYNFL